MYSMTPLADGSSHSAREFLSSQPITLEASNSDTPFHVHENLLRSVSPVLLAAISREWNEKTTRRYKFREDVTEELLLHFLMWTYHGSYHVDNENKTMKAGNDKDYAFDFGHKKKPRKKKYLVEEPVEVPIDVLYDGQAKESASDKQKADQTASDKQKADQTAEGLDKLHPLLLHIKLYVFAEMYMIEPLKTLSMQKMIFQLKEFGALAEGYQRAAVFDALTFVFSSRLPEQDVLLHWLARYASWKLDELKQMPSSFDALLLQTDGNFATLLVRYVQKSSLNPFDLKTEDIMPRYPISIGRS